MKTKKAIIRMAWLVLRSRRVRAEMREGGRTGEGSESRVNELK